MVAVYTQPDRPAGRGRKITASSVKQTALDRGMPIEQPDDFRSVSTRARLADYQPDLVVVVAYGLILPAAVLDTARFGAINVHASLLPRWRGAAPIQRAILAGDRETGISIMRMEPGLDTGDVLLRQAIPITDRETAASLHDKLAVLGAELLRKSVQRIAAGDQAAQPQDTAGATYAAKITKLEAKIDWFQNTDLLDRKIRAFNPFPVAWTLYRGNRLRVWAAHPADSDGGHAAPGQITAVRRDRILVATGDGLLAVTEVQPEGGKPMSINAFLGSRSLRVGERLGL